MAGDGVGDRAGGAAFIAAAAPSLVIGIVIMIVFSCLRRKKQRFYEPRTRLFDIDPGLALPPPSGDGLFSWFCASMVSDDDMLKTAGPDGYVFLVFLRFGLHLFAALTLCNVAPLMIAYSYGGNDYGDIGQFTLANVKNESKRLWAPVAITWLASFLCYLLLHRAAKRIATTLQGHDMRRGAEQNSVMVVDLPADRRTDAELKNLFEQRFQGQVQHAVVVPETEDLDAALEEWKEMRKQRVHAEAELAAEGERPKHRPVGDACCGGGGIAEVDSIEYFTEKERELRAKVHQLRGTAYEMTGCGFVTFTKASTAAAARDTAVGDGIVVEEAPEPRSVYWENAALSEESRERKKKIVCCGTACLVFLFMIPITFISTLTTLDNLESTVPFVEHIVDVSPALEAFLVGFLPTVALLIFMVLLPGLMRWLATLEGCRSFELIEASVIRKMYFFLFVNIFVVVSVGGSLIASLDDIDQVSFFADLGEGVSTLSTFFGGFIFAQAFLALPFELLRIGALILNGMLKMKMAITEQEKRELDDPGFGNGAGDSDPMYGVWAAECLTFFVIGLVYSTVAPLVTPIVIIYFGMCIVVYSYNIMYVYRPRFQYFGRLWPVMFNRVMFGIGVFQFVMWLVLALKYSYVEGPFLAPLPFLSVGYWWWVNKNYVAVLKPARAGADQQEPYGGQDEQTSAYRRPTTVPEWDDVIVLNALQYINPHYKPTDTELPAVQKD
eukprot:TRINITY_DN42978_c0_g1_i1.p1 TRINITY_DN42978_c0_g1~~TRINITY_DN42978_c0_g1_i1.p1  ORF type:complete len:724 (+),score=312.31 TRINITY_DN42978_c0_g1_i1:90-2261(+)